MECGGTSILSLGKSYPTKKEKKKKEKRKKKKEKRKIDDHPSPCMHVDGPPKKNLSRVYNYILHNFEERYSSPNPIKPTKINPHFCLQYSSSVSKITPIFFGPKFI